MTDEFKSCERWNDAWNLDEVMDGRMSILELLIRNVLRGGEGGGGRGWRRRQTKSGTLEQSSVQRDIFPLCSNNFMTLSLIFNGYIQ